MLSYYSANRMSRCVAKLLKV